MQLAPDERALVIAGWCRSRTWKTVADELNALEETAAQVQATGSLGDLPLVVMTVTGSNWMPGLPPDFPIDQLQYVWMQMQQDLVKLSSNSTHVIAEKSSHFIQFDRPELVIKAVRQLVETVRQQKRTGTSGI
jgi:hypothetical protein